MSSTFLSAKLSRQLAAFVVIALLTTAGVYFLFSPVISQIVCDYYESNPRIVRQKTDDALDVFAAYIHDNGVSVSNADLISQWARRQPLMILQIYRDGRLQYDSTLASITVLHNHLAYHAPSTHQSFRTITFSDGPASVSITVFPEHAMVDWLAKALLGLCGLVFLSAVLLAIRHKVLYLVRLEQEVLAIAGGDLCLPLTRQGSDELAMLAECVDEMRTSLLARVRAEEAHRQQSYTPISALSHDLRTPLTALNGYLEVLRKQNLPDEQQAYVIKCIDKLTQVKTLSDLLFASLQAAGAAERLETMSADELTRSLLGNYIEDLSAAGIDVDCSLTGTNCVLLVQPTSLRRVLDNVFSNLGKYAGTQVRIQSGKEDGGKIFWITFENTPNRVYPSGSKLGLSICEDLMRNMRGRFETHTVENRFTHRVSWTIADAGAPMRKADV
ncbi:MAG: hypothetical protein FWG37_00015 [Clostridia bacterium]|nr:hypothetical protein [Clostridia bacterium]